MNLKLRLEKLRDEVRDLGGDRDTKIDPLALSSAIDQIIKDSDVSSEHAWRKYHTRHQLWRENKLELTRAVVSFGQGAIRAFLLVNGGAAISVLTFLGNVAVNQRELAAPLSLALLLFCSGLASGGLVAGFAYLTQWFYEVSVGRVSKAGVAFHIAAVVFSVASIALFISGVLVCYFGFRNSL